MDKMAKVRYLDYVRPTKAKGKVKEIYTQANNEIGLSADPVLLHSVDPRLLEYYYTLGRETLLVKGDVSRKEKDSIATIVSHQNRCQYCVDVHAVSVGAQDDELLMSALSNNDISSLSDHPYYPIITWFSEGKINDQILNLSTSTLSEYLGVYFYFHYTNRMVNLFVSESQVPSNIFKSLFYSIGKWYMKKYTSKSITPGNYSTKGNNTEEVSWCLETLNSCNRVTIMGKYLDRSISRILSKDVQIIIRRRLKTWNGKPMPLGKMWIHELTSDLDKNQKEYATFSLLVMFAGYMVSEKDISQLKQSLNHAQILRLASWSAYQVSNQLTHLKSIQLNQSLWNISAQLTSTSSRN
jgi:AhpD family alkylhydroperoxidase